MWFFQQDFKVECKVLFLLGHLSKMALTCYGGVVAHLAEKTADWLGIVAKVGDCYS